MFSHKKLLIASCLSAGLLAGFGCDSSDKDRDTVRRRDRISQRDDGRVIVDRDDRVIVDRDERVVGDRVAGRGLNGIPAAAVRVERGQGTNELSYRPPRSGTVYVYDVDSDKLVYSGLLRSDDKFILDPNDNRATINGRKVLDEDLKARHRFEVYFDADRR